MKASTLVSLIFAGVIEVGPEEQAIIDREFWSLVTPYGM